MGRKCVSEKILPKGRILYFNEEEHKYTDDLGNGFKKIRLNIKSKAKGSSGGGRIITYETVVSINDTLVVFASIYNKGDYDSIDLNILKENLGL